MKSLTLFLSLFILVFSSNSFAQSNSPCRYGNIVADLFNNNDTYLSDALFTRNSGGSFNTNNAQLQELAAYLDTLQLPQFIVKAHIVLRKSLVLYEPTHTLQWGKSWYDYNGNILNPNGDGNRLKQDWEANYRNVRIDMIDWWLNHAWGPYVLYENEPQGKNVVDVNVVLLNENNCWIDNLGISFYKLPNVGDEINIDNVDGGNENGKVVLSSCCNDDADDEEKYFYLSGGTGPLYPERSKDLRWEWEARNTHSFSNMGGGNKGANHDITVGGEKIYYVTVASYPHLSKPVVAVGEYTREKGRDAHLVVKLPKYFDGHRIPTYVVVECINETMVNVRMIRGGTQRNFPVVVSKDPADVEVDNQ